VKYHCTIDLLFDWFGLVCFANKNKNCHIADFKPVKPEINGEMILPPLVFPCTNIGLSSSILRKVVKSCLRVRPEFNNGGAASFEFTLGPEASFEERPPLVRRRLNLGLQLESGTQHRGVARAELG
jgi:hypothetical protein